MNIFHYLNLKVLGENTPNFDKLNVIRGENGTDNCVRDVLPCTAG